MTSPSPAEVNAVFPGNGNVCVELGPASALARREPTAMQLRPGDYISGPTQFALADGALWFMVFAVLGRIEPMALTSELSIRFLRPAVGHELWARADLERAGRRSIVGTVRVWTDDPDRPTAVAQGTYAVPDPATR